MKNAGKVKVLTWPQFLEVGAQVRRIWRLLRSACGVRLAARCLLLAGGCLLLAACGVLPAAGCFEKSTCQLGAHHLRQLAAFCQDASLNATLEERKAAQKPGHCASLIYTSGAHLPTFY